MALSYGAVSFEEVPQMSAKLRRVASFGGCREAPSTVMSTRARYVILVLVVCWSRLSARIPQGPRKRSRKDPAISVSRKDPTGIPQARPQATMK